MVAQEFFARNNHETLARKNPFKISVIGPSATGKSELGGELSQYYEKYSLPKTFHFNFGELFRLIAYSAHLFLLKDDLFIHQQNHRLHLINESNNKSEFDWVFYLKVLDDLEKAIDKGIYEFKAGKDGMRCFKNVKGKLIDFHNVLQSKGPERFGPAINSHRLIQNWAKRIRQKIIDKENPDILLGDGRTPLPDSNLVLFLTGSYEKRAKRKIASRNGQGNLEQMKKDLEIRDEEDKALIHCPENAWVVDTDNIETEELAQLVATAYHNRTTDFNISSLIQPHTKEKTFYSSLEETLENPLFQHAIRNHWPIKQRGIISNGIKVIETTIVISS